MANGTNKGGKIRHESVGAAMVACALCGAEVSKRQSIAVKGGRICKGHEEAQKIMAVNAARIRSRLPVTLVAVA